MQTRSEASSGVRCINFERWRTRDRHMEIPMSLPCLTRYSSNVHKLILRKTFGVRPNITPRLPAIRQNISRKSKCLDNSLTENFFGLLKLTTPDASNGV